MTIAKELTGVGFAPAAAHAVVGGGYNASLTAAGSSQATGTAVNSSLGMVAGADGTKAVTLPAVSAGTVTLFNNSGSTLKVYPPVGAAIAVPGTGVGSANAAFDHLTYKTMTYIYFSATQIVPMVTA